MNKQLSKDEEAQVGIGTMIVFIATILVAAVAAGVLIDTSQKLQDKSTRTGDAATQQVGSSLDALSVYGIRSGGAGDILRLEIWVQLAAGSEPIDLSDLVIQYQTDSGFLTYEQEDNDFSTAYAGSLDEEFLVYNSDGTTLSTDLVISSGERHMIVIGSDATGGTSLALSTDTDVTVDMVPSVGLTTTFGFQTPATFDDDNAFELA